MSVGNLFNENGLTVLISLLEDTLGECKKHYEGKAELLFDCPVCSANSGVFFDGKGNLQVNYVKGKYNCWACGESCNTKGSIKNLFKKFADGKTYIKYAKLGFRYNDDSFIFDEEDELTEKAPVVLPRFSLPINGMTENTPKFKDVNKYLTLRGLDSKIISKFNLHFGGDGFENRIIIPSYDLSGSLNYYTGRLIYKYQNRKVIKYKNFEAPKETFIFNEGLIDWNKRVFLVEGPFDHIVLPNSIPLLGKKLSNLLYNSIYYKAKKGITIVLDPDAREDSKKIFYKLDAGRLYGKVNYVDLPYDMDVSEIYQNYGLSGLRDVVIKQRRFKD